MNEVINFAKEAKKPLNIWIIVSAVLLIAVLGLVIFPNAIGISGNVINSNDAGIKAVDFINNYLTGGAGNASLSSVRDMGDMYETNVSYNGKIISTYITKDGKYFIQGAMSIDNPPVANTAAANQPVNVTKSAKPIANAYVFSYCPYGLQFEKALSPVYTLLKDKADINIVFIGAMHGEHEKTESLRQICVQKNYGKDMLWKYLDQFNANTAIGSCSGNATCLSPLLSSLMSSLSIDSAKIDSCMASDAEALYNTDMASAKQLGITGSPSFTINGAKVQPSSRTPEAIKKAICDAFTTAPSECSQTLSTAAASAGFGTAAASASSGSASAGCGA